MAPEEKMARAMTKTIKAAARVLVVSMRLLSI
jgi:hypothetical protein